MAPVRGTTRRSVAPMNLADEPGLCAIDANGHAFWPKVIPALGVAAGDRRHDHGGAVLDPVSEGR